jgi:hypothetical protein
MELHEYYSEINSRIEKIDFDALWKDFKPLKFALYNDKKCFFDGQYIEKTDDFFANTAIEFNGEVIAIWNVSEPTDSDVLTSKIVHEMFHGFQTISGEKRYADEMDALFEYCYSNENLSVKAEENRLLSELAEHFDYAKFTGFLGLRKMRAEQFEYEFRYETSIEQIEGTANFVELQTLKILDESKYLRKLQRMISSVADTERLFPVRIACYDIGALLLLVCKNNGIPASEAFSDKTFPEKLIENAAAATFTKSLFMQPQIDAFFARADELINRAIAKNDVIFDGETPLLGVNIYDAVCRRGYIITKYFVMFGDKKSPRTESGNFVVETSRRGFLKRIYRFEL